MRSLTFKLVLAFLAVSLVGAALSALFVRAATERAFERYLSEQEQAGLATSIATFYRAQNSLIGLERYLRDLRRPAPGEPPPPPLPRVVDTNGVIVIAGPERRPGGPPPPPPQAGQNRGYPIVVDGQTIAYIVTPLETPPRTPQEERYLTATAQAILAGALAATLLAVGLGVFLARTLTHPLRDLTTAAQSMAAGALTQDVPVRSEDEIGQLTRAFNQMSHNLAHENQLRRQMTADIAHELRNPLVVLSGYIEALRDQILKPTQERFNVLFDEVQRLMRLVDDLRTLSLADAGALSLNRRQTAPDELLAQTALLYQHRANQAGVTLDVQTTPPLHPLVVDADRLAQALGNLVSNAIRHTPAGGRITLSAHQDNGQTVLSVSDTGEGIPPDDLPHVFDRFYRVDKARAAHQDESGLGLAIVQSIVEAHAGRVSVQSQVGHGSAFVIQLPRPSG